MIKTNISMKKSQISICLALIAMNKPCRLAILVLASLMSIASHGQLFKPLGLGVEESKQIAEDFQPRMHVEGNTLFVCTNKGLYSKDLSSDESQWQLAGFENIPLQDYARSGNDILALRHNVGDEFLLLSHDGGKTYEDVTPEPFKQHSYGSNVMISLVQHPNDSNTLLVSSYYIGIYQSSDFGRTWKQLTGSMYGQFIGYHTSQPEIIYNSGETYIMSPVINISYDSGETWKEVLPERNADDRISRVAFSPVHPECWMAGGWCVIYKTTDNGQTWNAQSISEDNNHQTIWSFVAFDNKNSSIAYAVGFEETIKLMCSTDEGKSWTNPMYGPSQDWINDFQQYEGKLLIYADTDIFEVSKADLLAAYPFEEEPVAFTAGQMATIVLPTAPEASKGKYYRLDRVEGNEIVFEEEMQPKAHIPYIIVPSEDFCIELGSLDLKGLSRDTVSIDGVSFIGTFQKEEIKSKKGFYLDIIDATPDCILSDNTLKVGALRAFLQVHWDDPYSHGGTKAPAEKLQIVLHDHGTGLKTLSNSPLKGENIYDLNGRIVNGKLSNSKLPRGIYIKDGRKTFEK